MRKEYDFSQAVRGKHADKRIRIVGDPNSHNGREMAAKIQRTIERDLKRRASFKVVWSKLDRTERENIRATWLKKIKTALADPRPKN